ncbi:hypothetical protein BD560DRAFT_379781 [Blakeslea trispora]|nr:hypothetical protein BD560DRAFT_379781 [Blakeslea trispora]
MYYSSRSDQDAWTSCVRVILGLLEDSLLNGSTPSNRINLEGTWLQKNTSTESLSAPASPTTQSIKRKRSFSDYEQDRKLQKLSSNLANDIARSLSMSMDDVDMSLSPQPPLVSDFHTKPQEEYPVPTLRRISLSGNSTSNPSIEQWLDIQAHRHQMNIMDYKQLFQEKQASLRDEIDLLQQPDQSFESIRDHLTRVLRLADELSEDHSLSFNKIFPEWSLYETRINQLASYVQSVEDMSLSIAKVIPQSDDLLQDIKGLQSLLDAKTSLYGEVLVQNGLEWKAMGMPVNETLLNATKQWIHNLCQGLLVALSSECKKAQVLVQDMKALVYSPVGEKLMACILAGLEFIAEASTFTGMTSQRNLNECYILVTVYGQWVSENLEQIIDKSKKNKSYSTTKRTDIRFMQFMENMNRVLTCLYTLCDLHDFDTTKSVNYVENLTAVLVELTVRAVSVIEIHRENVVPNKAAAGNIMSRPQASFIYMGETLLTFASKILQLSDRKGAFVNRIKTLHSYLQDLEESLEAS